MQNALRLLRKFLAPTAVCRHSQQSFSNKNGAHNSFLHYAHSVSHIPLHLRFCKRAPALRLQCARLSGSAEVLVAVDPVEANVFAQQISETLISEGTIAQDKNKIFEANTIENTIAREKSRELSSPELHSELPERLNRLEHVVEQHGRSLASLSSQLEGQKQLFASILEDLKFLRADTQSKVQYLSPSSHGEAGLDILETDNVSARSSMQHSAAPWPEWTSFLLHLKSLPFFKEMVEVPDVGMPMTFDDPITVKHTLAKFSQAYEHIFDSLSVTHLRVLAEHGCPNDDRRTVASGKRLQNEFQIEGKSNSCGIGFSKPPNGNAKLSDVMQLIFTIAGVAKKDGTPDPVKLSILHLLEEITNMTSNCKHDNIVYPETSKDSGSVWQKPPLEKCQNVDTKIGLEGSSSSCDGEMLSRSDIWKCPRCFRMNRQSKIKCAECSFQQLKTSVSDVDSVMQNSNLLSENRINTKVSISGEETKEKTVLASTQFVEMHNNRQASISKGSPEQGLGDVPRRLLAAQEQQEVTLCEDAKHRGSAGIRDDSDTDEHSDIFDDILDCDNASSPIAEQDTSKKCSLSDLVRQNQKAFSSPRREKEAATAAEDYERKGARSSSDGQGNKHEDLDVNTRRRPYRAERNDLDMEAEDKDMLPQRSAGGGWTSTCSIKRNQSYNYKVGMGVKDSSGRTNSDDRSRTKGRQHYSREEAVPEDGQRYGSSKTYGNESKPCSDRRGDSDKESEWGSRAERRAALERKRRNEGRMRY